MIPFTSIHQKAEEAAMQSTGDEPASVSNRFVNAWNTVKEDAKDMCNDVLQEQESQEEAVLHEEAKYHAQIHQVTLRKTYPQFSMI